ncbi:high affinity Mn2+ porin [Sphingomonas vulcanisoli]|uniref:High affinity Mn2+ porin n=1 Tax=Sphingomonas vulcanisoli TaxID=1658060 RepID=A0ABX0TP83_9SPHN|nr:carbohydrate porin [Sphingomonas vulcanisoli]NIJ06918.1 high affinity Mn2+ porin [Sphingomonas vulcanisoli]
MSLPRFALILAALAAMPARAEEQSWAIHGQATVVLQGTPGFHDPYQGANSLTPDQRKETFDATAYIGLRGWKGLELGVNPEIDQGFGLSDTLGVAGFPSAEAYKVGKKHPYFRLQRAFLRQTIDLGGDDQALESAVNQLGGHRTTDALIVTIGKFGVNDVFDTNKYAHDARHDVLNWALVDAGSFDYAADAWGYSTGASAELYRGDWTLRLGGFNLSKIPNGEVLERGFGQYQIDAEVEHRHKIGGRDGAMRVTIFRNRGQFGRFDDALALAAITGAAPDTSLVRRRMTRVGVSLNLEQAVSDAIGIFARAGINDGAIEPYDFTDVDRTVSAGAAIDGKGWGRAGDTIGIAFVVNGIAAAHQRYLAAGGTGVLVGDGKLPHPGAEAIGEAYYAWKPLKPIAVTLDYQLIGNPGYNRDRGPANIFALRLHGEF